MSRLLLVAVLLATAGAAFGLDGKVSGYIRDNTDADEFALLADSSDIDVVFSWPAGAEFWVTVFGRNHNELGEFNLADGDTINLTGGGLFYLRVFANSGYGNWSATWSDTD